jgi:cell division septation protein DedD
MKKETTGSSKKSSRLEKVIIPLLIVLVSLLSYSVGVLNGKKLSDREYSMKATEAASSHASNDEAAKDEEEMSDEDINQIASAAIEGAEKNSGKTVAGAHEVAVKEKNDEAPATQPAGAAHGKLPIAKDAVVAPVMAKKDAGHEAVKPAVVAKSVAPVAAKEEERAPSSVNKKPSSMLEYTVQVASYPEFKDAEKVAIDLQKKGYPAFIFKTDIKGLTYHRVSIGGYHTKKEAMTMQSDMIKNGIVKDAFVQKIAR